VSQIDDSARPRRRYRWFHWLFWPLFVVFFLVGVGAFYLWTMHKISESRLADATAEMDLRDPGWRLHEIEAARAVVPDEENSAAVIQATGKLLPHGWPPPEVKSLADLPPSPQQPLDPDACRQVSEVLDALKPALQEARKLEHLPRGRFAIAYRTNPYATLIPQVQWARSVAALLVLDALRGVEEGDCLQAARSCRAAINAGRSIGDEPIAVSQLARTAIVFNACGVAQRLLAHGELDDPELAELQRLVEDEEKYPRLLVTCRGERAVMHATLAAMENGQTPLDLERAGPLSRQELLETFLARDGIRIQHTRAFPMMNKLVEIAETPAPLRQQLVQEYQAVIAAHPKEVPLLLAPAVDKIEKAFTRLEAALRCLAAGIAAERYRCRNKKWPATLAELAPVYLAGVPLDPFDEQPLRYIHVADGIAIYSLCPGGDGKVFDPNMPSSGEGMAVRLWNVEQRSKRD
jgi:hypothetical protein